MAGVCGALSTTPYPQLADLTCEDKQNSALSQGCYRSSADWLLTLEDDDCVPEYMTRSVFGYCDGFHKRYVLGEILGTGSWGVVREATDLLTIGQYAVKVLRKRHPRTGSITVGYLKKIRNEVQLLGAMRGCPEVVQLYRVYEDKDNVYLVMQLCEGGSLAERFRLGAQTEQDIMHLVRGVMQFIAECHSREIVYRDIKPSNFLYLSKEHGSKLVAVDMGLAIRHFHDDPNLKSRTGTPAFMAPEVINKNYSYKADVWSVGCLAYQLLTGTLPWPTASARYSDVLQAILDIEINFLPLYGKISNEAIDFLSNVLVKDPELRLDAEEALAHPWLSSEFATDNVNQLCRTYVSAMRA
eukprot:TRINITY_DN4386_c0_g3_i1.p1 TRINITY_DN4386_c0_g3~~TRINITY_DN4386_c0_g3_i1.p1  ORF type:complete len:415 (+),score=10.38 TRINITY_DN4386_c0_g3_i1:182-1246(+)